MCTNIYIQGLLFIVSRYPQKYLALQEKNNRLTVSIS